VVLLNTEASIPAATPYLRHDAGMAYAKRVASGRHDMEHRDEGAAMDTGTSGVGVRLSDQDIKSVYEQLGLTTASDRAGFDSFTNQPTKVAFDVVISTTSQPFA
jgi:hypothetical protein